MLRATLTALRRQGMEELRKSGEALARETKQQCPGHPGGAQSAPARGGSPVLPRTVGFGFPGGPRRSSGALVRGRQRHGRLAWHGNLFSDPAPGEQDQRTTGETGETMLEAFAKDLDCSKLLLGELL